MFRDKDEELQRLQQELLAEEEPEEAPEEQRQELLEEDLVDTLLDEGIQGENPRVYQNYSNDYGRQLRNFASGYRAYNGDRIEEDPQQYTQELLSTPRRRSGRTTLALLLAMVAILACVLVWLFLKKEGLL